MRIESDIKLDFKDVLFRPKKSFLQSRNDVNLVKNMSFKHVKDYIWSGIPIMAANMDTTGTFETALEFYGNQMFTCIHKYYSVDDWINFLNKCDNSIGRNIFEYISVTSGITSNDLKKLDEIICNIPDIRFISLDVANGYTNSFIEIVAATREKYPDKVIIAGTVVTAEITAELLSKGADIIRVGIGGGSVCTTRKKTGVGYPQLSAVIECADIAHKLGGYIISDGGCTCPGDFSKAFGGGADFVMAGGIFSGHTESGGNLVEVDGKSYKEFYGMSSKTAMDKHSGGVSSYKTEEGKRVLIPFKGPIKNTILDILGGIRSTCTYVGVKNLEELCDNTIFIRVTQQLNEIYGKS